MSLLKQISLIFLLLLSTRTFGQAPSGLVDLTQWNRTQTPNLSLQGEWLYFWDLLETEAELIDGQFLTHPTGLVRSGTAWKDIKPGLTHEFGVITYALHLKGLKQSQEPLGITFGQFMNAHRAYAYDPQSHQLTQLSSVGKISRDPALSIPQLRKVIAPLPPASDELWLIVQASAHVVPGTFAFVPEISDWTRVQQEEAHSAYAAFWILGMFSLLFVSNLSLFVLRRDDVSSLMMAGFSLVMGLRYASTEALLTIYFPEPNLWTFAISYCFIASALPLGLCFYLHFFAATFPGHYPSWALRSAYGLAGFHLFLNAMTLSRPDWPHLDAQIMAALLIFCGILVVQLVRLTKRKASGAALSLLGFMILLVAMTNDVLVFLQFYPFFYVGHFGMLAFIFTQSLVVSKNFAQAFRTARHLSRDLQQEVERQTRDVKSILKNLHQGICTIHAGFKLGDDYSPFLEEILGSKDIAGRSAMDLIFNRSDSSRESIDMLRSTLEASLGEQLINFEVNVDNLIRELNFKDGKGHDKILLLEWDPVVNSKGSIEKILITLRDVTELKALEKKSQEHQRDMELIGEIIEISSDRFNQFLASSRRFLEENTRLLMRSEAAPEQELKIVFINYHTMKGAARTYRFFRMTQIIHDAEQFIAHVQRGGAGWDHQKALSDCARVRAVFAEYERVNRDKLKREESRDVVKLELETVRENIRALESIGEIHLDERLTPFVDRVRRTFFQLYFQELKLIFADAEKHLSQLSRDLYKPVPAVHMNSMAVGVTKEAAEVLNDILIHLYRNIMDHGLESTNDRLKKGKPEQGRIDVEIAISTRQELHLSFRDDGRGIQLDKITRLARERGVLPSGSTYGAEAVANLIFLPGFSTADGVTEISGRGIGMTAVREYLEKIGGHVEIRLLNPGKELDLQARPFALMITLPAPHFCLLPEEVKAA